MSNRVHYRIVIITVGPSVKKLIKGSLIHSFNIKYKMKLYKKGEKIFVAKEPYESNALRVLTL
jgi:hypothetical protein